MVGVARVRPIHGLETEQGPGEGGQSGPPSPCRSASETYPRRCFRIPIVARVPRIAPAEPKLRMARPFSISAAAGMAKPISAPAAAPQPHQVRLALGEVERLRELSVPDRQPGGTP